MAFVGGVVATGLDLSVLTNDKEFARMMHRNADQMPFALAKTITQTAKEAQTAELGAMKGAFDRPTAFTLGATRIKPATKKDLRGEVAIKDRNAKGVAPNKTLAATITGGRRRRKRSEIALAQFMGDREFIMPGESIRLNKSGDVPGKMMQKIIAALGSNGGGYMGSKYIFAVKPGRRGGLTPGVWQRMKSGKVKPLLIFVRRSSHQKIFDFENVAEKAVNRRIYKNFAHNFRMAVNSKQNRKR